MTAIRMQIPGRGAKAFPHGFYAAVNALQRRVEPAESAANSDLEAVEEEHALAA